MTCFADASLVRLSKIAQSSKEYYQLLQNGPQAEHFLPFLESLPEASRAYFQQEGFERSRINILFRRFVLEQAGQRMETYLQNRLDVSEYKLWQEQDTYQTQLLLHLKQSA